MKSYTCPHCGKLLPPETIKAITDDYASDYGRKGGSRETPKKLAAQKANMQKLNDSYTPEKRKLAAQKRLATLAKKKEQKESDYKNEIL